MIKVGHTENFTMKDVNAKNCLNTHIMETGGVKGLTVTACTFKNTSSIAMQFLYTKNLTISDNTISSTPRGIAVYTHPEGSASVLPAILPEIL